MTGSMWVPIVVPIVALLALGSWLGMIYYANAHPAHSAHSAHPAHPARPQYQHGSARQAGVTDGLPVTDPSEGSNGQAVGAARGDAPQPAPAQPGRRAA